jgi:hypothetical protein
MLVCRDLSWIAASRSGSVAAVSSTGDVSVHDAATGSQHWKYQVAGQPLTYCTFLAATDRLVVASTFLFVFNGKEIAMKLSGHTVCFLAAVRGLHSCQVLQGEVTSEQ